MNVLVVNAGSSSLKLSLLDEHNATIAARELDDWAGDVRVIAEFSAASVDAVGHRVVHGGTHYTSAVTLDDEVMRELRAFTSLAPLHQPRSLAAIAAAQAALPGLPHVACFDTAFHSTMPPAAHTYALPPAWRARWPLRRFGFHGLSHAYAARRAAELAGRPVEALKIVTCHLGAGASLCAVDRGRSIDTTMGFTPLEGLVMATRSGTVDPGLVLWLLEPGRLDVATVLDGLEHGSGLVGLARTNDVRTLIERRDRGDADAQLAFDVYAHRLRRELGAMVAVLDGLDVCVFTGGVGEHAPAVRAACRLPLDDARNVATTRDGEISPDGADVRSFVVTAREDVEIARQVRACLDQSRDRL